MLRFVAPCLLSLVACSSPEEPVVELRGPTMGTTWTVTIAGIHDRADSARAEQVILRTLADVDRTLSAWNTRSELSALNDDRQGDWLRVSEPLYTVLDAALDVSRRTSGAFDVTVAPLVAVWGFGAYATTNVALPSEAQIQDARTLVGPGMLELRASPREARKHAPGVRLDLDGIAPGYAVDRISRELAALGFDNHIVEIGGEVRCRGRAPGGRPWRVAVERPQAGARIAQIIVALDGLGISSSGDYRDYRLVDGKRISHTIDPRNGRPVEHELASVSVVHDSVMMADAYATALMVLGPAEGYELAERLELPALFIEHADNGFAMRATPLFERLQMRDRTLQRGAHY
jgi:thiamine biosynthesis lipoprotein